MSKSGRTWLGAAGLLVVVVAAILIAAGGSTAKRNVVARRTAAASTLKMQYANGFGPDKQGTNSPDQTKTSIVPVKPTCGQQANGQVVVHTIDPQTEAPGKTVYQVPFVIVPGEPPRPVTVDLTGAGVPQGTPLIVEAPLNCPGGTSVTPTTGVVTADGSGGFSHREQPSGPRNVTLTHSGSPQFGSFDVNWAPPSDLGSCKSGPASGYDVSIYLRRDAMTPWELRSRVSGDDRGSSSFRVSSSPQQYKALVSMKSPCGDGAGGQSGVVTVAGTGY